MTKSLWLIVCCLIAPFQISANDLREKDERAICKIVENWITGWRACDPQLTTKGFTEDADWMNAFGIKTRGRIELTKFLDWVFSLPNAKERNDSESISSIRFVKSNVAIVYSDFHVEKQRYSTGEEMADRKGHIIRVLVKENDEWQIVSMIIMDEKSRVAAPSDKGWSKHS